MKIPFIEIKSIHMLFKTVKLKQIGISLFNLCLCTDKYLLKSIYWNIWAITKRVTQNNTYCFESLNCFFFLFLLDLSHFTVTDILLLTCFVNIFLSFKISFCCLNYFTSNGTCGEAFAAKRRRESYNDNIKGWHDTYIP